MEHVPTVLIVDDNPTNVKLLEAHLAVTGFKTATAFDGEEALRQIARSAPDLVLLDVMMPKLDGFEVCRRIKENEQTRLIAVVMVTALDQIEDKVKGIDAGADDFLTKPVNRLELLARTRSLVKTKRLNDQVLTLQSQLRDINAGLEMQVNERTAELQHAMSDLRALNEELSHAQGETIFRLAKAAEYRDEDTAAHLYRMSNYTYLLAEALGREKEFCLLIKNAATMHDVGKIGTPDSILLKQGQLTPDEYEQMKEHTLIGAKILGGSSSVVLQMSERIALCHHERFDGTGYPRRLAGQAIPFEARLVAIADVFDALTTKRVYKRAFEIEEAMTILRTNSGTHFDPVIFAAFVSIFEKILDIKRRFTEQGELLPA